MANYCHNELYISPESFDIIIPMILNNNEVDFNLISSEYPQSTQSPRWAYYTKLYENLIYFTTKWVEPQEWFEALVNKINMDKINPVHLSLKSGEPGCGWGVEYTVQMCDGIATINKRVMDDAEMYEYLGIENDVITMVREHLENEDHVWSLFMAVGHVHDLLYDKYNDVIVNALSDGGVITIKNIVEPDGVQFIFKEYFDLSINLLTDNIASGLPDSSPEESYIDDLASLATFLYELMESHGHVVEDLYDY